MATLKIKRVAVDSYCAVVSGCVVGDIYTLQFRVNAGVVGGDVWRDGIAGLYPESDGTITTWNWPLPNKDYSTSFRVANDRTGEVTNTVTIDPKNPPPIGQPVGGGFNLLLLIMVAIGAFLLLMWWLFGR